MNNRLTCNGLESQGTRIGNKIDLAGLLVLNVEQQAIKIAVLII